MLNQAIILKPLTLFARWVILVFDILILKLAVNRCDINTEGPKGVKWELGLTSFQITETGLGHWKRKKKSKGTHCLQSSPEDLL